MINVGQIVTLFYDEGRGLIKDPHWLVEEYDNGLLKVKKDYSYLTEKQKEFHQFTEKETGSSIKKEENSVIFNMRSTGFHKLEFPE